MDDFFLLLIVSVVQARTNCFFLQLNLKELDPGNSALGWLAMEASGGRLRGSRAHQPDTHTHTHTHTEVATALSLFSFPRLPWEPWGPAIDPGVWKSLLSLQSQGSPRGCPRAGQQAALGSSGKHQILPGVTVRGKGVLSQTELSREGTGGREE